MHDLARRIYQAFSPEPLTAVQQDLYVDLDDVRGDADVVSRLDRTIRFAERPTCQVLAGHKGSGKTTELLRLQQRLQTAEAEDRYFVVFCSADDDIDRNDVDFPDVLIAIIRQMATQLRERAKYDSADTGLFTFEYERRGELRRAGAGGAHGESGYPSAGIDAVRTGHREDATDDRTADETRRDSRLAGIRFGC